jgi:Asp-tRNA(Asn)/Glu-tRNA(Gln) amidotransferase A subunit family amidase
MVPVALGTQTAGSVVRPAAYCGVYGFKPSRGWTSTAGIWLLAEQLDTVGLFARSAADLTMLHRALRSGAAGPPGGDRQSPARRAGAPPAVAVLAAGEWADCDEEVHDALVFAAGRLSGAGWDVRDIPMPPSWRHLPRHHATVMSVEVAKNLRARLGARVMRISESAQAVVEQGEACSATEYLAALEAREEARGILAPLAVAADLVLAPSALGAAPEGLAFTGDPVMCRPWTLLGLPAANVPAYRRADGLPVGVQLVGLAGDDLSFLADLALAETVLTQKED